MALGPVGSGQAAKLVNQLIVAVNIGALAEGLQFAERLGLNCSALLEALAGGFADSRVRKVPGPRMVARDFSARGAIKMHLKDLRLAADTPSTAFAELRHANIALRHFADLVEGGLGDLDHSAYMLAYDDMVPRFDETR